MFDVRSAVPVFTIRIAAPSGFQPMSLPSFVNFVPAHSGRSLMISSSRRGQWREASGPTDMDNPAGLGEARWSGARDGVKYPGSSPRLSLCLPARSSASRSAPPDPRQRLPHVLRVLPITRIAAAIRNMLLSSATIRHLLQQSIGDVRLASLGYPLDKSEILSGLGCCGDNQRFNHGHRFLKN